MQAELRQHVFTALQLHAQQSPPSAQIAPLPASFHASIEGRLLLDVVKEYLSFHHLHQTLSILRLETQPPSSPSHITLLDRHSLSRSLHLSASSVPPSHSVLHSLYLHTQSSRPSSPLLSPRSEDHPLPLTHPAHSHLARHGHEDLTPPISPSPSPPRRPSLPPDDDDRRRLSEVERELSRLNASLSTPPHDSEHGLELGSEEVSTSLSTYDKDDVVTSEVAWAKRYDYVEDAQHV